MKPGSQRLTADELASFLAPFSSVARSLCIASRDAVLKVFPDAIETTGRKELGYGFDRGYKGLVFVISMKKNGVNLGVAQGATLDDPDCLLRGTGKVHRHVEILDSAALSDRALKELMARAVARKRSSFGHPGGA
ncbi:DUF1801 domain-containing protein [Nevskia soli]|uniref:DUF1801 domain-containing protein n=1 Tax=Nevskia soli TaxID=418856 RepID=UPI001C5C8787|nr:DUF1801 domain-containing protein [Nevskia soli]